MDSKSDICMAKNSKDTNNKMHIERRMNFVMNGEKCKMHKIDWCEGGIQLVDIDTNNFGEHYLTPGMKYYGKTWKLRQKNCTRGVTEYRIVYGTRVMYD